MEEREREGLDIYINKEDIKIEPRQHTYSCH